MLDICLYFKNDVADAGERRVRLVIVNGEHKLAEPTASDDFLVFAATKKAPEHSGLGPPDEVEDLVSDRPEVSIVVDDKPGYAFSGLIGEPSFSVVKVFLAVGGWRC
jgi:hypothetical protein